MKPFLDEFFLLQTETAKQLYHSYAVKTPIVDYHCHINPAEIAQDRQFENITQAWLEGDHYKWRLMRSCGIDEAYITGNRSDKEKFMAFAQVLPKAIGNPLYHWCHLELQRYFDCSIALFSETAEEVWEICNKRIAQQDRSVRGIIKVSDVTTIVTTDDPIDALEHHAYIQQDTTFDVAVLPGWRPDKAIYIERDEFTSYMQKLSDVSGITITDMNSLYSALANRMDFFASLGCCASDHGINNVIYAPASQEYLNALLARRLAGEALNGNEVSAFQYALLVFLGKEYNKRSWVMEIHYGAVRNNNTAMFSQIGADTGFDSINNANSMVGLSKFLDELNQIGQLPKTILFSLNPNDNAALTSLIGCFQSTEAKCKIQHGAAWWFNDTKSGMEEQMINLANMSCLGYFVGMLTDSRSFLSYTRHEYFRRILCNLFGNWVENGEYPNNIPALGKMVEDISYNNAMQYFNF